VAATATPRNPGNPVQRRHLGKIILFNGATSEKYFRKLALPLLSTPDNLDLIRMPSTSPANAGMSFEQKLAAWRRLLDYLE
jgi:TDG/mug DNA glycosylase family protein